MLYAFIEALNVCPNAATITNNPAPIFRIALNTFNQRSPYRLIFAVNDERDAFWQKAALPFALSPSIVT